MSLINIVNLIIWLKNNHAWISLEFSLFDGILVKNGGGYLGNDEKEAAGISARYSMLEDNEYSQ